MCWLTIRKRASLQDTNNVMFGLKLKIFTTYFNVNLTYKVKQK